MVQHKCTVGAVYEYQSLVVAAPVGCKDDPAECRLRDNVSSPMECKVCLRTKARYVFLA